MEINLSDGVRKGSEGQFKILINAFPKSGTHLLLNLFSLILGYSYRGIDVDMADESRPYKVFREMRPGDLVKGHLPWRTEFDKSLASNGISVRSITRDPRDMVVSMYKYIMKHPAHPMHRFYSILDSDDARLNKTITGFDCYVDGVGTRDIGSRLASWSGWLKHKDICFTRFEELIGERGGGDKERQLVAVAKILNSIGIEPDGAELERYSDMVFDERVHSFREGKIGSWKHEFMAHHKDMFKSVAQWYLEEQGYEADDSW